MRGIHFAAGGLVFRLVMENQSRCGEIDIFGGRDFFAEDNGVFYAFVGIPGAVQRGLQSGVAAIGQ